VAGGHVDEAKTLARHFLENFERFVRGEPLLDRVMCDSCASAPFRP
jgi:hypothetical protein